jgi:hypothetical protein
MLDAASFDRAQIAYVAIGMIKVSGAAFFWKKFWSRLLSRPR